MLPDRVSNPGPQTYESGALPIALRGPASSSYKQIPIFNSFRHKIFVCKFSKNVKSKLYHIENSKTRRQTV